MTMLDRCRKNASAANFRVNPCKVSCQATHIQAAFPQKNLQEFALQAFPPPALYLVRARRANADPCQTPSFLWVAACQKPYNEAGQCRFLKSSC